MSDLDEIRKRILKRKETKYPLNDDNFKNFYNFMIKFMVVIVVVLVSLSYVKLNPEKNIKDLVLNDTNYQKVTTWLSNSLLSFLPDETKEVSSTISYNHVKGDYYKNNSNQVLNLDAGRVIETGNDDSLGAYVVVLTKQGVEVTYSEINNVMVGLYDEIEQGMVLGSYDEKFILEFEYLGKKISYEEYQRMA